ncbi:hypothetical protein MMC10_011335 [Thelotrema lepadinum]|nr:hypothetical protein [Thelotrema lepadinum]
MSAKTLPQNATEKQVQLHFQNRLRVLNKTASYQSKAIATMKKIWFAYNEDMTYPGVLTNLLVDSFSLHIGAPTLIAVAKIVTLKPREKNAVIRVLSHHLSEKTSGVQRLTSADCELLYKRIRNKTIDLANYSNDVLNEDEIRELDFSESMTARSETISRNNVPDNHGNEGPDSEGDTIYLRPIRRNVRPPNDLDATEHESNGGQSAKRAPQPHLPENNPGMHEREIQEDDNPGYERQESIASSDRPLAELRGNMVIPSLQNRTSVSQQAKSPFMRGFGNITAGASFENATAGSGFENATPGSGSGNATPGPIYGNPFDQARHERIQSRTPYMPGTPADPFGGVQAPTFDWPSEYTEPEYSILDRHRTLRVFEPTEDSEPIKQIFAYADSLRALHDRGQFQSLRFSVMSHGDVFATEVIWKEDPAAQFRLSQLIAANTRVSEEFQTGVWTLKVNVTPLILAVK